MNHKYEIDLFWSSEDAAFLAEVPDLEGCMAHGATHEEALLEAQAAIELWLDVAREMGREVPEPSTLRNSRL
ncbi:MAG TPA: type II toxin-antitoxin system HicB family antitoxin [Planctomycetota bacterium]|jgi:predicted RNase H-like HicB family nuclease|nr:type II toxin-antitoxin system HicB family antitoxin [Planctomycetota bacterium]